MNYINTTDIAASSVFARANHELRSCLALIQGSLQLVESSHPQIRLSHHWKQIQEALKNANRILNDLSDYIHTIYPPELLISECSAVRESAPPDEPGPVNSFDSEQFLQMEYCDLYDLVQSLCSSFASEASRRDISISVHVKPDALSAMQSFYCDPARIRRVFINLIKNAMEASDKGGRITISFSLLYRSGEADAPCLSVDVANTGSVIDPDVLPYIFQPFFTTKENGSGLGLSIVRELIGLHGGTVRADSDEHGTTFHILLPLD